MSNKKKKKKKKKKKMKMKMKMKSLPWLKLGWERAHERKTKVEWKTFLQLFPYLF